MASSASGRRDGHLEKTFALEGSILAIFKLVGAATVDDLIDLATIVVRFGHDAVSQKSRSEREAPRWVK